MKICKWCKGWLAVYAIGKNDQPIYQCYDCGRKQP